MPPRSSAVEGERRRRQLEFDELREDQLLSYKDSVRRSRMPRQAHVQTSDGPLVAFAVPASPELRMSTAKSRPPPAA